MWDLTAGKLLHDFKFHEGHISSLDFHPLEFLLATGDLSTFEQLRQLRVVGAYMCTISIYRFFNNYILLLLGRYKEGIFSKEY